MWGCPGSQGQWVELLGALCSGGPGLLLLTQAVYSTPLSHPGSGRPGSGPGSAFGCEALGGCVAQDLCDSSELLHQQALTESRVSEAPPLPTAVASVASGGPACLPQERVPTCQIPCEKEHCKPQGTLHCLTLA